MRIYKIQNYIFISIHYPVFLLYVHGLRFLYTLYYKSISMTFIRNPDGSFVLSSVPGVRLTLFAIKGQNNSVYQVDDNTKNSENQCSD